MSPEAATIFARRRGGPFRVRAARTLLWAFVTFLVVATILFLLYSSLPIAARLMDQVCGGLGGCPKTTW
jgi:type VI protein secretion system component VasK